MAALAGPSCSPACSSEPGCDPRLAPRDHLDERTLVPYLKRQAETPRARLEGATRADAMLLAATGVAVIFEAKVLSDISAHVTFDLARNQLARTIDVMLEANLALAAPLSLRKPERTFLVLLTPALTLCRSNIDLCGLSCGYAAW